MAKNNVSALGPPAAVRGARELRVTHGSVWLTGQGKADEPAQDVWLAEGESVSLPSGSRIVLEGYAEAQFQLLVPPCETRSASLLLRLSSRLSSLVS